MEPSRNPSAHSASTASISSPSVLLAVPASIGPYYVLSVLGEGGFGVVYEVERRVPIHQRVALKLIKPGMDSRAVIARFEQERQALAVMDHPNIARVLDAGATDAGMPYFVMELVRGEPITTYCDRHRLTVRQRLELMVPVCEAIQHAHMKGVIHRDLKPTNILIQETAGQPAPKVIDFGIAKAISHSLTDKSIFTERGQMVGTPEYMSPEQARLGAVDVDTRTDVYSLGVVLYELLTGVLPFEKEALRAAGYDEIRRIIREVDPPKPSTRLSLLGAEAASKAATSRQTRASDLRGELRRDLDWIPLTAMRKERERRYRTPIDLADDLRNYLEGRPLDARPESEVYRARKFLRRNSGAVVATVAVIAALGLGLVGSVWQAVRATKERDRAQMSDALASARLDQLRQALATLIDPFYQDIAQNYEESLDPLMAADDFEVNGALVALELQPVVDIAYGKDDPYAASVREFAVMLIQIEGFSAPVPRERLMLAKKLMLEAVTIRRTHARDEPHRLVLSLLGLARALDDLQDIAGKAEALMEAHVFLVGEHGPSDRRSMRLAGWIADCHATLGDPAKADEWRAKGGTAAESRSP